LSNLHHRRSTCRLCGGHKLTSVLALTPTPPANAFVDEDHLSQKQACFDLELFFCSDCAHVQLLDVVDPRVLFEHYVYVSGTSPVFVRHFQNYADSVIQRYAPKPGSLVVDIGSNDGTLLRCFQTMGHQVLGIDPAIEIAQNASKNGIETKAAFFTPNLAQELLTGYGQASVVTANNVFAHADGLAEIVKGIHTLLDRDGVFVFEVSYLLDVVEKCLFDTIYHEHLAYHSVKPLQAFFANHNMQLIDVERVDSHGGSLRGYVQRDDGTREVSANVAKAIAVEERAGLDRAETYHAFAAQIDQLKCDLNDLLQSIKAQNKSIAGFGAPAKATTLMYHFGIGPETIDYIIDDSPLKQNLYSPGMHIPVVPSVALNTQPPDYLLILAWNFAEPIMSNHKNFTSSGGHFIVPLPEIKVY